MKTYRSEYFTKLFLLFKRLFVYPVTVFLALEHSLHFLKSHIGPELLIFTGKVVDKFVESQNRVLTSDDFIESRFEFRFSEYFFDHEPENVGVDIATVLLPDINVRRILFL